MTTTATPRHVRGRLWAIRVGRHEVFRGCARDMRFGLREVRAALRAGVTDPDELATAAERGVWRRHHPTGGDPPADPFEVTLDLARAGVDGYSTYLRT